MAHTTYTVSFVDAQTIQIRLELGEILDAAQTTEFPEGAVVLPGGYVNDANGHGIGKSWGDNKFFFGFDTYNASSIADLFDTTVINGVAQAPADIVSSWQVRVGGQTATVEAISRKTHVLDSAQVGPWNDFAFKTVENVFLRLSSPIPEGANITVAFNDPDFPQISAVYDPEKVVSEAIHVNLKGFDPDDA